MVWFMKGEERPAGEEVDAQGALEPPGEHPKISQEARRCPRCGRTRGRLHGRRRRAIRDWVFREVQLLRLRCDACGTTWTVYPQGVSPGAVSACGPSS